VKKLIAIGEALIDFAPNQMGVALKEVEQFIPHVGGAPANVCGAYHVLGGPAVMLTQLGQDPFGDKIIDTFHQYGLETQYIRRTTKANTSLAFVALTAGGDREFSFYRKPGADMLYAPEEVAKEAFEDAGILHFCSVSLGNFPMREAHCQAISYAKSRHMMVSFDPNLRPGLWENPDSMVSAVKDFLSYADILKLSEEELPVITGEKDIQAALPYLWKQGISLVLLTCGSKGAKAYTQQTSASVPGVKVCAVDTTGAGDGFIGSFLYQLSRDGVNQTQLASLTAVQLTNYLACSNAFSAQSVQYSGGLSSYDKSSLVSNHFLEEPSSLKEKERQ
jgi:fructokinase